MYWTNVCSTRAVRQQRSACSRGRHAVLRSASKPWPGSEASYARLQKDWTRRKTGEDSPAAEAPERYVPQNHEWQGDLSPEALHQAGLLARRRDGPGGGRLRESAFGVRRFQSEPEASRQPRARQGRRTVHHYPKEPFALPARNLARDSATPTTWSGDRGPRFGPTSWGRWMYPANPR